MNLDMIQKIHWTLYQTPSGVSSPPIYPSLDTLIYNLCLTYNGGLAIKTQLIKTQNSRGKSLTNNYLDVINKWNQLEKWFRCRNKTCSLTRNVLSTLYFASFANATTILQNILATFTFLF